jgi:hypothetical protein
MSDHEADLSIIKWAGDVFHPSCYPTLRISTLYEFRRVEMGDRSDETEGCYKYTVAFPKNTFVPAQSARRFLEGKIHWNPDRPILSPPYCLTMNSTWLAFGDTAPPGKTNIGANFEMTHEVWNGFVFCMSFSDAPDRPLFPGTKALWSISLDKADALADRLSSALLDIAMASDFSQFEHGLHKDRSPKDVAVRCEHGCVEYLPRDFLVALDETEAGLDELGRRIARSPFIKRPEAMVAGEMRNYRREKEYRFVFEFGADGIRMPAKLTHVDVTYNSFKDLVDLLPI